jgi:hypothetical protein
MPNFLTRKVGPLPVWGWAIGAGGVGALWYFNKKGAAATTGAPATSPALTSGAASGSNPLLVSTGGEQLYNYSGSVSSTSAANGGTGSTVTVGGAPGQPNAGVWQSNAAAYAGPTQQSAMSYLPLGTYPAAGAPQNGMTPVQGPNGIVWVLGENVATPPSGSVVSTIGGGAGPGHVRMGAMPRPSWVGSGAHNNLRHQSMARARKPQRIG